MEEEERKGEGGIARCCHLMAVSAHNHEEFTELVSSNYLFVALLHTAV